MSSADGMGSALSMGARHLSRSACMVQRQRKCLAPLTKRSPLMPPKVQKDPFCHYKVRVPKPKDAYLQEVDVTGDGRPDTLYVFEGEISFTGSERACRKMLARLAPRSIGAKSPIRTKLFQIKKIGVPENSNNILGIVPGFYGNQRTYLSYPPFEKGRISFRDLDRANAFYFSVGNQKIGLGTVASFVLRDGRIIKGVISNIGFLKYAGTDKEFAIVLPANNVNIYIFSGLQTHKVDLSDIVSVAGISAEEKIALERKFQEKNISVSDLIDKLSER